MKKQKFLNNLVCLQIPRRKKTKLAAKLIKAENYFSYTRLARTGKSKPETTGIPRLKPAA